MCAELAEENKITNELKDITSLHNKKASLKLENNTEREMQKVR